MFDIPLYDHQQKMIDEVRYHMKAGEKYILLQGATGIGKSRTALSMMAQIYAKGKRTAFNVPRKELLKQMSGTLEQFDVPHSFVADGYMHNPYSHIWITSAGTLVRRLPKIMPDVIFIDETHWGGNTLDKIITHYKAAGSYIVGLTATPKLMNGNGLDKWYDVMVQGPSVRWLIDNKFLSDYRIFAPSTPDLKGIKTVAGDYARGTLAERMEADRVLVGDAVKHYRQHAMGRLCIAFCTSIKHSQIVAESFRNDGIPAAHIDGEMSTAERNKLIRSFALREIWVLTCADLLCFGFDLAANAGIDVTVEALSVLRPTQSIPLWMQILGRVLRYKDFPAMIMDHSGNALRLGLPDDERNWTLHGDYVEDRETGDRAAPTKVCDQCFYTHRPAPKCPNCGRVYEVKSREIDEIDGVLTEISRDSIARAPVDPVKMQEALDVLVKRALAQGKPLWLAQKWAAEKVTKQYRVGK